MKPRWLHSNMSRNERANWLLLFVVLAIAVLAIFIYEDYQLVERYIRCCPVRTHTMRAQPRITSVRFQTARDYPLGLAVLRVNLLTLNGARAVQAVNNVHFRDLSRSHFSHAA